METETKNPPENIEELIRENLKLTQEIHAMTKKIKSYVTFQKFLSIFYLLLFVIPLILSIIYIPIFMRSYLAPYQELLNNGQSGNSINNAGDMLNQAQKLLNNK